MSTQSILNYDAFKERLGAELNKAMMDAAEPLIQEALARIERKMREQMAQKLIGLIEADYVFDRAGADIRILVRQARPDRG